MPLLCCFRLEAAYGKHGLGENALIDVMAGQLSVVAYLFVK